jgi:hypothetical protein
MEKKERKRREERPSRGGLSHAKSGAGAISPSLFPLSLGEPQMLSIEEGRVAVSRMSTLPRCSLREAPNHSIAWVYGVHCQLSREIEEARHGQSFSSTRAPRSMRSGYRVILVVPLVRIVQIVFRVLIIITVI